MSDLTPEQRDQMRAYHHSRTPADQVRRCRCALGLRQGWPCDAARLLDALEAAEADARSHQEGADAWYDKAQRARRQRDDAVAALGDVLAALEGEAGDHWQSCVYAEDAYRIATDARERIEGGTDEQ